MRKPNGFTTGLALALAVIAICFALVGCDGSTTRQPVGMDGDIYINNGYGGATVTNITLKDGTHCAVLVGGHAGAISCNWK